MAPSLSSKPPPARNRVLAARERDFRAKWAAVIEARRRQIDPAPNWRALADALPRVIAGYARDRNRDKVDAFKAKTPRNRMWNRVIVSLPLADLARAGDGVYSDRGGTVVRSLPAAALAALRDYRKEAEAWRTEASGNGRPKGKADGESLSDAKRAAVRFLDSEALGIAPPEPPFARVVLSWQARSGVILFELRTFDAKGYSVGGSLESVRSSGDRPEPVKGRPTRPYPRIVLAQLMDCDALNLFDRIELTEEERAAGRDVRRNDPQVYAALPYLAEAQRRNRSLVVPLPDVTPRSEKPTYDLLDATDIERLALAEREGVLTTTGELASAAEEAVDRAALAEALANVRRETNNLLPRARWAWATRHQDEDSTAVRWPFMARLGVPTMARVDPFDWLPILGGLTDAQRVQGLGRGLALSSLSPELRARVRRIVFHLDYSERTEPSAWAEPALRWPDGWRGGRLLLRKRREYFLLGKGGIGSLDADDFARARLVAASPSEYEGEVVADVSHVRAGLREWTTLEVRIEDRIWSGEMEEVLRLDPPTSPEKLPAPWLRWLESGRSGPPSQPPPP